ncbi:MAG: hypothetical protein AB7E79_14740 [Rhodospirillaceae bacterium]
MTSKWTIVAPFIVALLITTGAVFVALDAREDASAAQNDLSVAARQMELLRADLNEAQAKIAAVQAPIAGPADRAEETAQLEQKLAAVEIENTALRAKLRSVEQNARQTRHTADLWRDLFDYTWRTREPGEGTVAATSVGEKPSAVADARAN